MRKSSLSYLLYIFLLTPELVIAQSYPIENRDYLEVFEANDALAIINEKVGLNEDFLKIPIRYKKTISLNMPMQVKVDDKVGQVFVKNQHGIYYGSYYEFKENGEIKFFAKGAVNSPDHKYALGKADIWYFKGDSDGVKNFCIFDYKTSQKLISCGKLPTSADTIIIDKKTQIIELLNFGYHNSYPDNEEHFFNFRITKHSQNKNFKIPRLNSKKAEDYIFVTYDKPATYAFILHKDLSLDLLGTGIIIEKYIDDNHISSHAQGKVNNKTYSLSQHNINISIKPLETGKFLITKTDEKYE